MTTRNVALAAAALLATGADGHICILHPEQRGGFNISTAGDPSCYIRTGYCGGSSPVNPTVKFAAGEKAKLVFEQNLNHWNAAAPGYIDVAVSYNVANPTDSDWVELAKFDDFPAHEMVSRTVFEVDVTIPTKAASHAALRMRYVSKNPGEVDPKTNTDATFYNCADIEITSSDVKSDELAAKAELPSTRSSYSCSTPPSWSAAVREKNPFGEVEHHIFWDATTQQTRWSRRGHLDRTGVTDISLLNDYNKSLEYVDFESAKPEHCPLYGPDAWYDWSYGGEHMQYQGRDKGIDVWTGGNGQYKWATRDLGSGLCQPVFWEHGLHRAEVVAFKSGPIPAKVFVPKPICVHNPSFEGCHAEAARAAFRAAYPELS